MLICETDQQREELTHCYYSTLGGDPSSPILQLATLISAVAVAGRKNNANGELAGHLADLKKSEALRASQAPELRRYLEQLNSVLYKATSSTAFASCPLRPPAMTPWSNAWFGRRALALGSSYSDSFSER